MTPPLCSVVSIGLVLLVLGANPEPAPSKPPRGFLGFSYSCSVPDDGNRLKVLGVLAGGPADTAGIKVGDVITAVNGVGFAFADQSAVAKAFSWVAEGDRLVIQLQRSEKEITVDLTAGSVPSSYREAIEEQETRTTAVAWLVPLSAFGDTVQIESLIGKRYFVEARADGSVALSEIDRGARRSAGEEEARKVLENLPLIQESLNTTPAGLRLEVRELTPDGKSVELRLGVVPTSAGAP